MLNGDKLQAGDRLQTHVRVGAICEVGDVGWFIDLDGPVRANVRFHSPPGSDKLPYMASIALDDLSPAQ